MHPLITTRRLAGLLDSAKPPVVLDVRWTLGGPSGHLAYQRGHLPGAVFVDLDTELSGPPGAGGRHPLPAPEALQAVLRRAGVYEDSTVVAYDAADGAVAARAWWLLRWAGHASVAVLDGGFAAWQAESRPIVTDVPLPLPGGLVVRPGAMPVLTADEARELARAGVLLDARAPERYRGDNEPLDARPGHVPGAVNAPYANHIGPDGRWRTPVELAAAFTRLGVGDGPVGAYCGSGVTACSVLVALEASGLTDPTRPAALYAGSWSQYARQAARPAATGPDPG